MIKVWCIIAGYILTNGMKKINTSMSEQAEPSSAIIQYFSQLYFTASSVDYLKYKSTIQNKSFYEQNVVKT